MYSSIDGVWDEVAKAVGVAAGTAAKRRAAKQAENAALLEMQLLAKQRVSIPESTILGMPTTTFYILAASSILVTGVGIYLITRR